MYNDSVSYLDIYTKISKYTKKTKTIDVHIFIVIITLWEVSKRWHQWSWQLEEVGK